MTNLNLYPKDSDWSYMYPFRAPYHRATGPPGNYGGLEGFRYTESASTSVVGTLVG